MFPIFVCACFYVKTQQYLWMKRKLKGNSFKTNVSFKALTVDTNFGVQTGKLYLISVYTKLTGEKTWNAYLQVMDKRNSENIRQLSQIVASSENL